MTVDEKVQASLCMPFPLRRGYIAQAVIPRDLTKQEADRLCAFVQSLAQPEPPETQPC